MVTWRDRLPIHGVLRPDGTISFREYYDLATILSLHNLYGDTDPAKTRPWESCTTLAGARGCFGSACP